METQTHNPGQAHNRGGAQAEERADAAERRSTILAEVGKELAGSLDYMATLQAVARIAVPRLADWCIVDFVEEDGKVRRIGVAAADPAKEQVLRELQDGIRWS